MSGVTKSGRVVKKSAKMMEMEEQEAFDDSVDTRKRKKQSNSRNKPAEKKFNLVDSAISTCYSSCVPLTLNDPTHIGSELSVVSDSIGDENVVMVDTISGSDSNVGAEYYLEGDNSSHQMGVSHQHKLSPNKPLAFTTTKDASLSSPQGTHDAVKLKKTSKRKDRKSDVRKPSAAFVEWSKSQTKNMAGEHPDCDTNVLQDQLTGFWRCVSAKEKMRWHRKAQRGGEVVEQDVEENLVEKTPLSPVSISAHFSLIGDSLVNLGTRLQEHKGKVALEGNLSILLNSLLSTLTLLMALTNNMSLLEDSASDVHQDAIEKIKGFFEIG